jgi:hypothetical protein
MRAKLGQVTRIAGVPYIRCRDCRREIQMAKAMKVTGRDGDGGYLCRACGNYYGPATFVLNDRKKVRLP